MIEIRLVEKRDLEKLAQVFVNSFNSISPEKPWDYQHAFEYLSYWTKKQPDMFWGAFEGITPVGAMAINIKPWRTEVRCSDGVVFVDNHYQNKGVGASLFKKVVTEAVDKYKAKSFEAVTFAEKEFPFSWYKKMGLDKDEGVIFIKGKCSDIIKNLN